MESSMTLPRMRRPLAAALMTTLAVLLAAPAALAQGATTYQATLSSLNGAGTNGTATVQVSGRTVTATVTTDSASSGLPHAQHIHIGGQNICPPPSADTDGDGFVSTPEGEPFYGGIEVSLTTSGDVSTESALAVDRFPVAGPNGQVTYSRTFELPPGVDPAAIAQGVIVQHGFAGSALGSDPMMYDGPDSPLMAGVPMEATLPVACGSLSALPGGGAATGGGGTADGPNRSPVLASVAALGLLGVAGTALRWRTTA